MIPRKYYEVTDNGIHVGYVLEEYVLKKHDEKILTGKAVCNILIREDEAIDAEPVKHGHWYDEPNYLGTSRTMYFCSRCGSASFREDPYCWHCGAKMEGGKDNGRD